MKALRLRWLSRRGQVQQSRLMSMLLPARLKHSIIIVSDVTRPGISQVHSFDSSLQSRSSAIPSALVSPLYLWSLWAGLGSRSSLHTPLKTPSELPAHQVNCFVCSINCLYLHHHYHGLSGHLTPERHSHFSIYTAIVSNTWSTKCHLHTKH